MHYQYQGNIQRGNSSLSETIILELELFLRIETIIYWRYARQQTNNMPSI